MTDGADPKLIERYRNLAAEEPPRALDDAILATARRSARPWTRRWAVPLSLAAVVVLSVTVTLRIQHEQPGIESPEPARAPSRVQAPAEQTVAPQSKTESVRAKKEIKDSNAARNEPVPFQAGARDKVAAVSGVAPSAPSAPEEGGADSIIQKNKLEAKRESYEQRERQAAAPAPAAVAAKPALQGALGDSLAKRADEAVLPPEKELERIAQLRRDGKHEDADKALAEFRKRYPDYRIDKAMLDRVERR